MQYIFGSVDKCLNTRRKQGVSLTFGYVVHENEARPAKKAELQDKSFFLLRLVVLFLLVLWSSGGKCLSLFVHAYARLFQRREAGGFRFNGSINSIKEVQRPFIRTKSALVLDRYCIELLCFFEKRCRVLML